MRIINGPSLLFFVKNEDRVTQGDIIKNCPVARLVTDIKVIYPGDGIKLASIDYMDGVVNSSM